MNMKEKNKKLVRPLLVAMFAVLLILGGTYAWLRISLTAANPNIIKAGALDLRIDETPTEGAEVRLERAVPQSYRQGITNKPYKFTLINNSTIDTDYTITLEDFYEGADASLTASDKIADELIRYILVKNDEEMVATNSKLLSTGRAIDAGTISGKRGNTPTEIPYTLYVWIDSKAGDDGTEADIMNKIFNARLNITSEQHHTATEPVQTGFQPTYFAFGDNITTSSPTDYTTLNNINVFLGLDLQGNKGVCMNRSGTVHCFQAGATTVLYEQTHLQRVFQDGTCSYDSVSSHWNCSVDDFNCVVGDNGFVYCGDHGADKHCYVDFEGDVNCF